MDPFTEHALLPAGVRGSGVQAMEPILKGSQHVGMGHMCGLWRTFLSLALAKTPVWWMCGWGLCWSTLPVLPPARHDGIRPGRPQILWSARVLLLYRTAHQPR